MPLTDGTRRPLILRHPVISMTAVAGAVACVVGFTALATAGDEATVSHPPVTVEAVAPTTSLAVTTTVATSTTTVHDDSHEATPADQATVLELTSRFEAAWLHPGTPEERAAMLAPVATARLAGMLTHVETLPVLTAGGWRVVSLDGIQGRLVRPGVAVGVVMQADGWRVATVEQGT